MTQKELEYYLQNFYGYGQWKSDFYFIGIEEGGGKNLCLVNSKLSSLLAFSETKSQLLDNFIHQITRVPVNCAEGREFFVSKIQTTWKPFIKMLLILSGTNLAPGINDILHFQINSWGRIQPEFPHAVIELLPLPNPGLNDSHWNYNTWSSSFIPPFHLINRQHYIKLIIQDRIHHLALQIRLHKPRLVVFYASSQPYSGYWNDIVQQVSPGNVWTDFGILLTNSNGTNYRAIYSNVIHNNGWHTLFVICNQPAGVYGNSAAYFDNLTTGIQLMI